MPTLPSPSSPAGRSITELPPRTFYRRNAAGASPLAPVRRVHSFQSKALVRTVRTELLLPPAALGGGAGAPVLYLNDGQDVDAVALPATLERLWATGLLPPVIVVAIHANADRLQEYGVSSAADYRGRGSRAGQHAQFIVEELRPWVEATYRPATGRAYTAIAGFSLGGLSALDVAWNHFALFGAVGVLSGALWWRARDVRDPLYTDADRLMHQQLAGAPWRASSQRFWFQTGTQDETNDRNHNGVIDAIDDTLDALTILRQRGYPEEDLRYLEIEDGRHHQTTWAEALPDFLLWAFGEK
ncbi:MAG: esterase family protein [Hymenobacteraceae bacterium]|nr:esterase family protein [Hymenobacteraceae bacterium]